MAHFAPICVPCRKEMQCKKNDYLFSPDESVVWAGDMYECPKCKAQIITGFGKGAIAYEHEPKFERYATQSNLTLDR